MIGDRADTDVAGAQAVGMEGILLTLPDSPAGQPEVDWVAPDHRIESLFDLFG